MPSKRNPTINYFTRISVKSIGIAFLFLMGCRVKLSAQEHRIFSADYSHLAGTKLLTAEAVKELRPRMLKGITDYFLQALDSSRQKRSVYWHRNYQSDENYVKSIAPNRARFKKIIGVVEQQKQVNALTLIENTSQKAVVAKTKLYTVYNVRWPVFDDVSGTGLWIEPNTKVRAQVVVLPDADQTPEMLMGLRPGLPAAEQFARRLAAAGCRVVIPVLINRKDTWSGNPKVKMTNETHREFIYRMAYEAGRSLIGYEVQKVLGVVDWFTHMNQRNSTHLPIAVAGYGEGGLIAFYSAAVDQRIDAALISGYFQERLGIWKEPIYRNIWGLLTEFGDAEIAGLIAPRHLVIEASKGPEVDGPPPAVNNRNDAAASGRLQTPPLKSVRTEFDKAKKVFQKLGVPENLQLVVDGKNGTGMPGSTGALQRLLNAIGVKAAIPELKTTLLHDRRVKFDTGNRMHEQITELIQHIEKIIKQSKNKRKKFFWDKVDTSSTLRKYELSVKPFRAYLWKHILGKMPPPSEPFNARTRLAYITPKWRGYWVELNVWPHIIAGGILLIPKDLQPGEKRPVVVCKHGLGGRPEEIIDTTIKSIYHSFGAKLADSGYVVYAPQSLYGLMPNQPYGKRSFRIIDRMAEPLNKTVYSVMIGQQTQTLDWLKQLPFIDGKHIGVYGLSWGGKSDIRIAAILKDYSVVICSGDFNQWVWKTTSLDFGYSYMYLPEYDMYSYNFANTFNYAEFAALIAPRPFMVERGHNDRNATDSEVAYEYARVRKLYDHLGISDRTRIEYFNGPHEIHGGETFQFLNKYLKLPGDKHN